MVGPEPTVRWSAACSTLFTLPMNGAAAHGQQRLIQRQPADADDDDGGVDIGKAKARAPDGNVISKPDGIADHLRDHDDDDGYRQRNAQARKNARHGGGKDHAAKDGHASGAAVLRTPDQPRLHAAKPEIARDHDRVETFEKRERDLRGRSDSEDIGKDREQRDLRDRIADEEDRLEQVAYERGARHRDGEWNADQYGKSETGERTGNRHARMMDQGAIAGFVHQRREDRPWTRQQAGVNQAARNRHLPEEEQQRYRIPTGDVAPDRGRHQTCDHCTNRSSVPIIWPLSRRARTASSRRSPRNPRAA